MTTKPLEATFILDTFPFTEVIIKIKLRASETVQQVKALASKPDDLSSIPRSLKVEG